MGLEALLDFLMGLRLREWIALFWPFFLFDFIRYILLDLLVVAVFLPRRRLQRSKRDGARQQLFREGPVVTVIAPGKNEGRHLSKLVQSLRKQTYPSIELIVVDDGSEDETPILGRNLERQGKIDLFLRNEVRGGKASAANMALNYARGRYIVHMDADSQLEPDAIETLLVPFYLDPALGAVGGDIRVANAEASFATQLQAIEYMKGISVGRTVSSTLGLLRIVAGAYGAFRRDVLDRVGGWDVGPGLDGDLVQKIRKLGYAIHHEPYAICYTNVPPTFRRLAKQRVRWDRSLIRFRLRKHRDLMAPHANFRFRNALSSVENIFFNLALNAKWWIYLTQMLLFRSERLLLVLAVIYLLYLAANVLQFLVGMALWGAPLRRTQCLLGLFLPLMPFYMGFFIRIVRTYAYLMELISKASFRDPWNPWKVSSVIHRERL